MVYHVMPYMVGLIGRGQVMLPHSDVQTKILLARHSSTWETAPTHSSVTASPAHLT